MKKIYIVLLTYLVVALAPSISLAQSTPSFGFGSSTVQVAPNLTTTLTISLSTGGQSTTGADAVIAFDPTKIEITTIQFSTPNAYAHNFSSVDSTNGVIKLTSTFSDVASSYNGSGTYATLTIKGKAEGQSTLSFRCQQGATNDTNILKQGSGQDIVNCSALGTVAVSVSESAPASTATPQSSGNQSDSISSTSNSSSTTCSPLRSSPTNLRATTQSTEAIILNWTQESNAKYYTLKYGTSQGNYQYGAANIGNGNTFAVNRLRPNTTYYFAIAGVNDCSTSEFIGAFAKTKAVRTSQVGGQTITPTPEPLPSDIPSFDTLAALHAQSVAIPTTMPVVDETLGSDAPMEEENLFPERSPASVDMKKKGSLLPLIAGAGIGALVVIAIIISAILRKKDQQPPPSGSSSSMQEV